AANEAAVATYVRNQGLYVTQIKKAGGNENSIFKSTLFEKQITLYDIAMFCRQFATLIGAGVSLINALEIMVEQTANKRLQAIIMTISADVHKGLSLSLAMGTHKQVFPELMIHMIEAGEVGGILEGVLERLATQYEKDYRMNARLKSAMIYPGVVITIATIAVGIILTFVMPTFTELFQSMNLALPWPTQVVMKASDFLLGYWWLLFALVALVYVAYAQANKNHAFCFWRDGLLLKLPVFGELYNKVIITRFAGVFAGLSRSGVPILSALAIVAKATGSLQAEMVLNAARSNVQRGRDLSVPLQESKLFPPLVVHMVAIGEETGTLDIMLEKIEIFYAAEVDDMLGRLQTLLDPFLIVILGVMVGFIAVAMLLPMFDIVTKVGQM
ncbi:MAG: type II secretion system F family protein, partial [Acidaminococcaceae bacterium]